MILAFTQLTDARAKALDLVGIGSLALWMFVAGLVCGFIGAVLGMFKNRKALGLFLGMMFGPLGWLVLLFAQDGEEDEGFLNLISTLAFAALCNLAISTAVWKIVIRPAIDRTAQIAREAEEKQNAERARQMAEFERERYGEQSVTAVGTVVPPMRGEWMWRGKRNPLDGTPYRQMQPQLREGSIEEAARVQRLRDIETRYRTQ